MKKTSMTLLTTAMLSFSFVGADNGAVTSEPVQIENNGHHLYVGPDVFNVHYPKNLLDGNNTVFGGLRLGYEYLTPNAFYAATDVVGALGKNRSHVSTLDEKDPKFTKRVSEVFHGDKGHFWSNAEQRFGYTFSGSPSSTVSVYAGPGFHYEHIPTQHAYWWYGTAGVKAVQQVTENFSIGADVQATLGFAAKDNIFTRALLTQQEDKTFWGYKVALPLKWNVGESRAFDIQLSPYLLKFNVDSNQTILGGTASVGYSF